MKKLKFKDRQCFWVVASRKGDGERTFASYEDGDGEDIVNQPNPWLAVQFEHCALAEAWLKRTGREGVPYYILTKTTFRGRDAIMAQIRGTDIMRLG